MYRINSSVPESLKDVIADMADRPLSADEFLEALDRLSAASPGWERHIEHNPEIQGGAPILTGTRLPVKSVVERLHRGESIDDLMDEYPGIPRDAFDVVRVHASRIRRDHSWRDD